MMMAKGSLSDCSGNQARPRSGIAELAFFSPFDTRIAVRPTGYKSAEAGISISASQRTPLLLGPWADAGYLNLGYHPLHEIIVGETKVGDQMIQVV